MLHVSKIVLSCISGLCFIIIEKCNHNLHFTVVVEWYLWINCYLKQQFPCSVHNVHATHKTSDSLRNAKEVLYQHFVEMFCFPIQDQTGLRSWRRRQQIPPKHWYLLIRLQGVTNQRTITWEIYRWNDYWRTLFVKV